MDAHSIIDDITQKLHTIESDLAALDELWQAASSTDPVKLAIPWLSQIDDTATYARGDCAMACVAMILHSRLQHVTVDDVSRASGLLAGFVGASWVDAQQAAAHFGLRLDHAADVPLAAVLAELRAGRPVICLLNYQSIPRALRYNEPYNAGHFVLAVGFDNEHMLVHDPYWPASPDQRGAFVFYPRADFVTAWSTIAPGNRLKCQVLQVAS